MNYAVSSQVPWDTTAKADGHLTQMSVLRMFVGLDGGPFYESIKLQRKEHVLIVDLDRELHLYALIITD